ncbi:MAG TPA: hypothetical protein VIS05_02100 [Ilumatobacter sp.]
MFALFAESNTGWVVGYVIGIAVVLVVVALVLPILLLAKSIGGVASQINSGLEGAVEHTSHLTELNTTIESAAAITDGLRRGRKKLGG